MPNLAKSLIAISATTVVFTVFCLSYKYKVNKKPDKYIPCKSEKEW